MTKKIALIGSAPSSVRLAPYSDPEWQLWCCSPGAYPHVSVTRPQAWYEIHRWEPPWGYTGAKPWFSEDYIKYLRALKCPVYMLEPTKDIPNSVALPVEDLLKKFGPHFWGSSLSYMFAMAILENPREISLFGVDMSATEEWQDQRPGCHYFISIAKAMGIKVWVPPESDLFLPCPMYGVKELDPMYIKLQTRMQELKAKLADCERQQTEAAQGILFFRGAIENNEYVMKTWITHPLQREMIYQNPEPMVLPPPKQPEMAATGADLVPASVNTAKSNGVHPHPADEAHGIAG